jgi:hypothetical protein
MLSILIAALEVILEDYARDNDARGAMFRIYELVQQFKS